MFESISNALGIEHKMENQREYPVPVKSQEEADAKDDFEYARERIRETIERTTDVFEDMIELARASEHPRSYEVVNQIASNIKDMAEALVKLHKDTGKSVKPVEQNITNNNTIAVASTKDIINMLRNKNKGEPANGITIEA